MSHKQISSKQRTELGVLLRAGLKQIEIAKILDKHKSTISRELRRNSEANSKYNVKTAKEKLKQRRLNANQRFRRITGNKWLIRYITKELKAYLSPEEIAGRLKFEFGMPILCHETIYRFIYKERPDLKKYLRCQKGKYRKRYGTKKRGKNRDEAKKKRIDLRPEIVENRYRIGDWEGDTVKGSDRKSAILTHVERKSGFLIADKLSRAKAEITRKTTVGSFKKIPKEKRYTITYDNAPEFEEHELIERDAEMEVYFANPYHSWERGTNENTNGLLRQFFPKKTSLKEVTQKQLDKAVKLINNRPRKRLNYLTPLEVFTGKVAFRIRI